jgi:hypothetical protein
MAAETARYHESHALCANYSTEDFMYALPFSKDGAGDDGADSSAAMLPPPAVSLLAPLLLDDGGGGL